MRASLGDASEKARLGNLLQNHASHGRGERITIERAALVPVRETASVLVRDKRAEGNAAAKPFSQNHHVRLNAGLLKGEESSSSADPRLNFIEDQKDAMVSARRSRRKACDATNTPASPWIGSSMTATVLAVIARSTCSISLSLTLRKLRTLGSNKCSHCAFPDADIAASVRPWKP